MWNCVFLHFSPNKTANREARVPLQTVNSRFNHSLPFVSTVFLDPRLDLCNKCSTIQTRTVKVILCDRPFGKFDLNGVILLYISFKLRFVIYIVVSNICWPFIFFKKFFTQCVHSNFKRLNIAIDYADVQFLIHSV